MQHGKERIGSEETRRQPNIFIAPVATGDGVNDAPAIPYRGLDHFGLSVNWHVDAIAADPQSQRRRVHPRPDHSVRPGTRVCFIKAPEGVSIELLDRNV